MFRKTALVAILGVTLIVSLVVAQSVSAESDAVKQKTWTIGVSHLGLSHPFPATIKKGMEIQAKALGVKLIPNDAQFDAAKQAAAVQDLLTQGIDGLLLSPADSAAAVGALRPALAKKVPVMTFAAKVGKQKGPVPPGVIAFISQKEIAAGATAARIALKAVPAGTKYAIVLGSAGFEDNTLRVVRFDSILKASGKAWQKVAAQSGQWTRDGARKACQNMFAANPDIGFFYAIEDDMAVGCADAVKAAGSKAKVIGIGGSKGALAAIRAGNLYGTVYYSPSTMGKLAVKTMVNYLNGIKPPSQYVSYPVHPVTKANVAKFKGSY